MNSKWFHYLQTANMLLFIFSVSNKRSSFIEVLAKKLPYFVTMLDGFSLITHTYGDKTRYVRKRSSSQEGQTDAF